MTKTITTDDVPSETTAQELPWQLRMFRKTLKKQQRFRLLRRLLGPVAAETKCLLVTCGDNNGAMNWHLRELGGQWTWADAEDRCIDEMSNLLDEPVLLIDPSRLPLPTEEFDIAVAIDVHEHLPDPQVFSKELARVTKDTGQIVVTVPGGDQRKLVNRLKNSIGMTKDEYGHYRDGFSIEELGQHVRQSGMIPKRASTFSRFFTELAELAINFAYVKKMSKKKEVEVDKGTIAPSTASQLNAVNKAYRVYSLVYPFVWLFSQLDWLLFFTRGYVVMIDARKDAPQ